MFTPDDDIWFYAVIAIALIITIRAFIESCRNVINSFRKH